MQISWQSAVIQSAVGRQCTRGSYFHFWPVKLFQIFSGRLPIADWMTADCQLRTANIFPKFDLPGYAIPEPIEDEAWKGEEEK